MGKQARNRKKAAARKQRQQEESGESTRRHQLYEEIYIHDRVWFERDEQDPDKPYWDRGVVKGVRSPSTGWFQTLQAGISSGMGAGWFSMRGSAAAPFPDDNDDNPSPTVYGVLPVNAEDRRGSIIEVPAEYIIQKDLCDWTLRFGVGDRVVCRLNVWTLATVVDLWPMDGKKPGDDAPPCYRCRRDNLNKYLSVPEDDDICIVEHPTCFRFSEGDDVVFSTSLARGLEGNNWEPWIRAKIRRIDIVGLRDYYSIYECAFKHLGRRITCHIVKDDDQHVAREDAGPRQRLLEAISQNCDYSHIDYLVKSFGIDFMSILDLLLSKAIESANYWALAWLQENASLDLHGIRSTDGSGLLHQISKSTHAEHFFEAAGEVEMVGYVSRTHCIRDMVSKGFDIEKGLLSQTDDKGRSWLHVLVTLGKTRALEFALSPSKGFAWTLAQWLRHLPKHVEDEGLSHIYIVTRDRLGMNVEDTANHLGRLMMKKMINEFAEWHLLYCLHYDLMNSEPVRDFPGATALSAFRSESTTVARRLIQFYSRWAGKSPDGAIVDVEAMLALMAQDGKYGQIRWLIDADPSALVLDYELWGIETTEDQNEFVQSELVGLIKSDYQPEGLNILSLAALGRSPSQGRGESSSATCRAYAATIDQTRINQGSGGVKALCAQIRKALETSDDYELKTVLKYKLSLLEDDRTLENRLKVLEYLITRKGVSVRPNPLDVVRWRQCGVLRWLVQSSLVDLESPACRQEDFRHYKRSIVFLKGQQIPPSVSVGTFLCFAAIEYDDLQTLEWILNQGVKSMEISGWNVVHACAFFGRLEILLCLLARSEEMMLLAKEPCTRKPDVGVHACHLAIRQGFVSVAKVLLSCGCPSQDDQGKDIFSHASKSEYRFVREWGKEMEDPVRLERDIQKLYSLLRAGSPAVETIKAHLSTRKCLDFRQWMECNYRFSTTMSQFRKTYVDVLQDLCDLEVADITVWLFSLLSPAAGDTSSDDFERFWQKNEWSGCSKRLGVDAMRAVASETKCEVLLINLSKPWVQGQMCFDPAEENPLLRKLFEFTTSSGVVAELTKLRNEILLTEALMSLLRSAKREVQRMLALGAPARTIAETIQVAIGTAEELSRREVVDLQSCFQEPGILSSEGVLNLDGEIWIEKEFDHTKASPLKRLMRFFHARGSEFKIVYRVLAVEGYCELISWSLSQKGNMWDAAKETEVVGIAAYLGHKEIVEIFLRGDSTTNFKASRSALVHSAILGAAEGGRATDLADFFQQEVVGVKFPPDPVAVAFDSIPLEFGDREARFKMLSSSLAGVSIFGCLFALNGQPSVPSSACPIGDPHWAVVRWLLSNSFTEAGTFIRAAAAILQDSYNLYAYERTIELLEVLLDELNLDTWAHKDTFLTLADTFIEAAKRDVYDGREGNPLGRFLSLIVKHSVDIQSLEFGYAMESQKKLANLLEFHKADQVRTWSQYDICKNGLSLEDTKSAIESGRVSLTGCDRAGLRIAHLAAAYDRVDVLKWLVEERGTSLEVVDAQGRDVEAVAKASDAVGVLNWFEHRKARERFQRMWTRPLRMIAQGLHSEATWSSIKVERHDMMGPEEILLTETARRLGDATSVTLRYTEEDDAEVSRLAVPDESDFEEDVDRIEIGRDEASSEPPLDMSHLERIKMTSNVMKWLRKGDRKYRDFFVRRMKQLAAGERSRSLSKRLVGCRSAIYETYLEQKAAHRILWTSGDEGHSLLIWYIAKHKDVSRLCGLIDDSESRSSRQMTSASALPEMAADGEESEEDAVEEQILLDPLGDTPLKLYQVNPDELHKLNDTTWSPPLFVTSREREIVETKGTVLLVGRSGTGKTCCICNRMDYDRQQFATANADFSQLFVARSQRLCNYVKDAVGDMDFVRPGDCSRTTFRSRFTIFNQLIKSLEKVLPTKEKSQPVFLQSRRMDFGRFKREVYRSHSAGGMDALVVWTNIRSFIKGSIEALLKLERTLSKAEYMNLGKKRCRLSPEQCRAVYTNFERYTKYMSELQLWDDCDRIASIADRLMLTRSAKDQSTFERVRYSKIYVDEAQDYTQGEIAVFFYLCGPGDLFLAGDPAQSVAEGVEFRFEEVRSVGYKLFGEERPDLIPNKPMTVTLNFRSHSGILNVAAAVLACLFRVFPDSAMQLKEDRGLFPGPRPGLFNKVPMLQLQKLVSKLDGVVVLTHDCDVSKCKMALGNYPLVYGIREAKGLEFQLMILVDFFCGVSPQLQKPWRNLLLGRDTADVSLQYPELEGSLKLLYTAITRCIQRLFFAETCTSVSGDAFSRWLTTTSPKKTKNDSSKAAAKVTTTCGPPFESGQALAVESGVDDVERMSRTPDEWRTAGLDNAIMAESADDLESAGSWLDRAIYCFQQADDASLASHARAHRSSLQFRQNLEASSGGHPVRRTSRSRSALVAIVPDTVAETDAAAALLVEKLLAEGLVAEAREVCHAILSSLPEQSQEWLKERVISRLPVSTTEET